MKATDHTMIHAIIGRHREGLDRLEKMWKDPKVLFYGDSIPKKRKSVCSIFLAGPTSRDAVPDYMWRKDAVHFLRVNGFTGLIFIPEPRGDSYLAERSEFDFTDSQVIYKWEHRGLKQATHRVFWIPRNKQQLLGLTTNREIGQWLGRAEYDQTISKSLFIGWPKNAVNMGSLAFELESSGVGYKQGKYFTSLLELCKQLVSVVKK